MIESGSGFLTGGVWCRRDGVFFHGSSRSHPPSTMSLRLVRTPPRQAQSTCRSRTSVLSIMSSFHRLAELSRTDRQALAPAVGYSVSSFLLLPELLLSGDLVAVVPSRLLRRRKRRLVILKPPIDVPGFDVIAVHPVVGCAPGRATRLARIVEKSDPLCCF